jgi:hypothetical protein
LDQQLLGLAMAGWRADMDYLELLSLAVIALGLVAMAVVLFML